MIMIRLNKRLVEIGYCSRRNADKLIAEGRVKVNGKTAQLGLQINDNDTIEIDGAILDNTDDKILIAYNKPKGVICTESKIEKAEKISDYILDICSELNINKRLFTIGRLDKDTTGLIFLTNDGDLAREITNTHNMYEKEYEVRVNKPIDKSFIDKIEKGVYIEDLDKTTLPCKIRKVTSDKYKFNIIIKQGLNRQVRRMCKTLGYRVNALKRVRVMNYNIGDLRPGEYKIISKKEIYG